MPKHGTRPTAITLKRRLFDANQNLVGRNFFDLCAGSGSMGFEAWSREATSVYLIESYRTSFNTLQSNLEYLHQKFSSQLAQRPIKLYKEKVEKFLSESFKDIYKSMSLDEQYSSLIFFDPPYEDHKLYEFVYEYFFVSNPGLFKGMICIESDMKKGVGLDFWASTSVEHQKVYKSGDHYFIIFQF